MSRRTAPCTQRYGRFTSDCHRERADQFAAAADRLLAEGDDEGYDAHMRAAAHHETMAVSIAIPLAA